jgi:thiol:disulfide interchange protein
MSPFSVPTRFHLLTFVLAGALLWLAPSVSFNAAEKKQPLSVKDLITFTWTLSPEDPFSKENAVGAMPKEFRRGETFFLTITGKPKEGYHTYPLTMRTDTQSGGNSKLTYSDDAFQPLWPVVESEPEVIDEGTDGGGINLEHEGPFTWRQEILVKRNAERDLQTLHLNIGLQVCDQSHCTLGDYPLDIPITVAQGNPVAPTPALLEKMKTPQPQPEVVAVNPLQVKRHPVKATTPPNGREDTPNVGSPKYSGNRDLNKGFVEFVLSGVWFGLISLVTPCVFPMIPITVSFFLKQAERKQNSPLLLASVYSSTIVAVLTIGGLVLSTVLAVVSQHWITNLVLGLLFLFFALSLFGMYEIMLPTSLVNFTSAREGTGGLAGTFFMALTFTIISFACVAPFYGSFLIFAASASGVADWLKLLCGALAYSVTFASPFFLLALFPTLLRTLPRSGSWMNTVKVVMGFIEVAAAVKFLRSAELAYFKSSSFLTFDFSLGIYIALCALCGLYLLNFYRLPHDHEAVQTIGVPRAMFAVLFVALGLYLTPALFKQPDGESQKPAGTVFEWIEAFLLPDENNSAPAVPGNGSQKTQLAWSGQLQEALKKAKEEKKPVFVDVTAIVCTNCRYNERTVFRKPAIVDLLDKYVLVKLYTDGIPKEMEPADPATENKQLQTQVFKSAQLPLYVVLKPSADSFDIVEEYDEGKINSPEKFAEFLKRNLPAN